MSSIGRPVCAARSFSFFWVSAVSCTSIRSMMWKKRSSGNGVERGHAWVRILETEMMPCLQSLGRIGTPSDIADVRDREKPGAERRAILGLGPGDYRAACLLRQVETMV